MAGLDDCPGRTYLAIADFALGQPHGAIVPKKTPTSRPQTSLFQFERGESFLPGIRVKEGESFESALRRFKKKCEKAGLMADLRRHQHFEKPSERRKRKVNAARRKALARRSQEN